MVAGQHRFVIPKYLYQYSSHAAWPEDSRRESNGALASGMLGLEVALKVAGRGRVLAASNVKQALTLPIESVFPTTHIA